MPETELGCGVTNYQPDLANPPHQVEIDKWVRVFPRDCNRECEHFRCYDLSIDDLVICCDLLKRCCDACDEDFVKIACPMYNNNTQPN